MIRPSAHPDDVYRAMLREAGEDRELVDTPATYSVGDPLDDFCACGGDPAVYCASCVREAIA